MKRKHLEVCLAGSLLTLSSMSMAASNLDNYLAMSLEQLMDIEVNIATSTSQSRRQAPSVVSVITEDMIKNTGATTLGEALEMVPGLQIWKSAFVGRPQPHFRGTNGTQTLLMVDGNSMRDLVWTFGFFWKGIPVAAINRIEIIRGPGSALFGADASAGVINVITKASRNIETSEAGIRAGRSDTYTAWAQHGAEVGEYNVNMTVNASTTGAAADIFSDTAYRGEAGYGWDSLDLRLSVGRGNWKVLLGYMDNSDIEVGLTGALVFDAKTRASEQRLNLDWLYEDRYFAPGWGMSAAVRFQDYGYESGAGFNESPPDGTYNDGKINRQKANERRLGVEVFFNYSRLDDHRIKLGAGQQWMDLYESEHYVNFGTDRNGAAIAPNSGFYSLNDSPYVFAPEETREVSWALLQDIWSINDDLELTTGLRYDYYSDFGGTFNPRLALVWDTTDKLTTKLLYGQAFKPPSFLQLYSDTSFSDPNSSLNPEESETFDLVFSYRPLNDLQIDTGFFYTSIEELIRLVGGTYQNAGSQTITGVELETNWQPVSHINVTANYTYLNAIDDSDLHVSQPGQTAYLGVDWSVSDRTMWNMQGNWIGENKVNSQIDDYFVVDTTLRHQYGKDWEVAASVRNVFDEDARKYVSRTQYMKDSGRNAYVEVRYRF